MDTLELPRQQAETAGGHLVESMTVNRVIHDFPKTRAMLESLRVNVPVEGCHCLDEVAWYHGLEPSELLTTLEGVISSCDCLSKKQAKEKALAQGVYVN